MKFYTTLFGWEISKWDGPADYWLIRTGPADRAASMGACSAAKGPAGRDATRQLFCLHGGRAERG